MHMIMFQEYMFIEFTDVMPIPIPYWYNSNSYEMQYHSSGFSNS